MILGLHHLKFPEPGIAKEVSMALVSSLYSCKIGYMLSIEVINRGTFGFAAKVAITTGFGTSKDFLSNKLLRKNETCINARCSTSSFAARY